MLNPQLWTNTKLWDASSLVLDSSFAACVHIKYSQLDNKEVKEVSNICSTIQTYTHIPQSVGFLFVVLFFLALDIRHVWYVIHISFHCLSWNPIAISLTE